VRLLITRPPPDAERTAAALHALGHGVVIAPLLDVQLVANAKIGAGPWAGVLVTSANAAQAIVQHQAHASLVGVRAFTVGERSAQAMRAAGFAAVTSADGDVHNLARVVAAHLNVPARLLYLAGEERSGDLAGALRGHGFAVDTVAIYRATTAEQFSQAAIDALTRGLDGVLHYSRRSAEAYVDAARQSGILAKALGLAHYCLSAQVAEPLTAAGATKVSIAAAPNEAALLALIGANTPQTHSPN
jgi:uroporphyrinogen-III synthase